LEPNWLGSFARHDSIAALWAWPFCVLWILKNL
jgi:hypothetical protein